MSSEQNLTKNTEYTNYYTISRNHRKNGLEGSSGGPSQEPSRGNNPIPQPLVPKASQWTFSLRCWRLPSWSMRRWMFVELPDFIPQWVGSQPVLMRGLLFSRCRTLCFSLVQLHESQQPIFLAFLKNPSASTAPSSLESAGGWDSFGAPKGISPRGAPGAVRFESADLSKVKPISHPSLQSLHPLRLSFFLGSKTVG